MGSRLSAACTIRQEARRLSVLFEGGKRKDSADNARVHAEQHAAEASLIISAVW